MMRGHRFVYSRLISRYIPHLDRHLVACDTWLLLALQNPACETRRCKARFSGGGRRTDRQTDRRTEGERGRGREREASAILMQVAANFRTRIHRYFYLEEDYTTTCAHHKGQITPPERCGEKICRQVGDTTYIAM